MIPGEMFMSSLSFWDGPKGRARNPETCTFIAMDSGFAASRRPGMTGEVRP